MSRVFLCERSMIKACASLRLKYISKKNIQKIFSRGKLSTTFAKKILCANFFRSIMYARSNDTSKIIFQIIFEAVGLTIIFVDPSSASRKRRSTQEQWQQRRRRPRRRRRSLQRRPRRRRRRGGSKPLFVPLNKILPQGRILLSDARSAKLDNCATIWRNIRKYG